MDALPALVGENVNSFQGVHGKSYRRVPAHRKELKSKKKVEQEKSWKVGWGLLFLIGKWVWFATLDAPQGLNAESFPAQPVLPAVFRAAI